MVLIGFDGTANLSVIKNRKTICPHVTPFCRVHPFFLYKNITNDHMAGINMKRNFRGVGVQLCRFSLFCFYARYININLKVYVRSTNHRWQTKCRPSSTIMFTGSVPNQFIYLLRNLRCSNSVKYCPFINSSFLCGLRTLVSRFAFFIASDSTAKITPTQLWYHHSLRNLVLWHSQISLTILNVFTL